MAGHAVKGLGGALSRRQFIARTGVGLGGLAIAGTGAACGSSGGGGGSGGSGGSGVIVIKGNTNRRRPM